MKVTKKIAPAFEDFMFDWDYETYLLVGGYGSGKSYHVATKIILKCLEEKRRVLVVREVFDTIYESCFALFCEILQSMNIYTEDRAVYRRSRNKVMAQKAPMQIRFPNGSRIIFKGMDNPEKVKSITDISIVWIEECSEVKYAGYMELLGRIRTPDKSMHFILSCNPVGRENWVYQHFFTRVDSRGHNHVIVDEQHFYDMGTLVHNGVYYHHSTPGDNPWLPYQYIARLDSIKDYDYPLYLVARLGMFGPSGTRVLPQLSVAVDGNKMDEMVKNLGLSNQYFGFDFGFEESFNAVISMSVDLKRGYLYVWDEIYQNHITDDMFAATDAMQRLKWHVADMNDAGYSNGIIVADNEDPKAIAYYRQNGFRMRPCMNKFAGSRLSNTRKVKRFKKIIVHPRCVNVIRELKDLTYKRDTHGNVIYDQFNIDPHTFSAIWYGLDTVTVADAKDKIYYSKRDDDWKEF